MTAPIIAAVRTKPMISSGNTNVVISASPTFLTVATGAGGICFVSAELFRIAQPSVVKTMTVTAMPASQPGDSTLWSGASPLRVSKIANTMRMAMAPT